MQVIEERTPSISDELLELYTPQRLSDAERDGVRERIFLSFEGEGEGDRLIAFRIMHRWFQDAGFAPETLSALQDTYWQWYVEIAWEILGQLPMEEASEVVVRTLPFAVGSFINVTPIYFSAVAKRLVPQIEQIHERIRKGLLAAQYSIALSEPRERFTMQEVVATTRKNLREDAMEFSVFLARLERALFGQSELPFPPELSQDIAERVRSFVDLVSFFLSDKVDPVSAMQRYVSDSLAQADPSLEDPNILAMIGANILQEARWQTEIDGRRTLSKTEEPTLTSASPSQNPPHPSISNIQKIIDAQFEKDKNGQYVDIAGVLAMLATLAERYGDESIRDWYYFDETTGKFHWQE